jgi:hypothetical protein
MREQFRTRNGYYHDHKADMDGQMRRQFENYRRLRNEAPGQLTRAALNNIPSIG